MPIWTDALDSLRGLFRERYTDTLRPETHRIEVQGNDLPDVRSHVYTVPIGGTYQVSVNGMPAREYTSTSNFSWRDQASELMNMSAENQARISRQQEALQAQRQYIQQTQENLRAAPLETLTQLLRAGLIDEASAYEILLGAKAEKKPKVWFVRKKA